MRLDDRVGDLDPELWFPCIHHPGARDIFYPSVGNTFRGRMPAWCETREVSFRISLSDLPDEIPAATRHWVRGFLAGCVPQLDVEADLDHAEKRVNKFLETGDWSDD